MANAHGQALYVLIHDYDVLGLGQVLCPIITLQCP